MHQNTRHTILHFNSVLFTQVFPSEPILLCIDSIILLRTPRLAREGVAQRCYVKKVFLEIFQNSQENTCARVSFLIKLKACNFIKIGLLVQVFSCEFCEVSKNTISYRTPLVAASVEKSDNARSNFAVFSVTFLKK